MTLKKLQKELEPRLWMFDGPKHEWKDELKEYRPVSRWASIIHNLDIDDSI